MKNINTRTGITISIIGLIVLTIFEYQKNRTLTSELSKITKITASQSKDIKNKDKTIKVLKKEVSDAKKSSLIQFTDKDLMQDITLNYPKISTRVKKQIIETVLKESLKYDINPLILYSLLHTESSMRPWIEHNPTTIVVNKKKVKIRAVGLGGVVWEWWGKQLKEKGIAEVRSDLFDPVINIKSTAYIYNELYKLKKYPSAKTQDESAMIRYFGGGYKWYFRKIDSKIARLVSNRIYRKTKTKD